MQKRLWLLTASIALLLITGCTAEEPDTKPDDSPAVSDTSADTDDVVKIQDKVFNQREMEFYTLMQKIFIERNRSEELSTQPEKADEINAYWDSQKAQYDNVNVQLQTLIELHSMALLAEEKSYYVPPEEIEESVKKMNGLIAGNPPIKKLADQYGQEDFDIEIFPYMKEYLLKQRIVEEIKKDIRADKPDVSETELAFEAGKMYDDLYEDQVSGLELEIYLK